MLSALFVMILLAVLIKALDTNIKWERFYYAFKSPHSNEAVLPDTPVLSELTEDPNLDVVERHCIGCHNSDIIIQNRMSRERWLSTIRWMQETQGLWQLGSDEVIVLDYLEKHYGQTEEGRRRPLDVASIEWYVLTTPE